MEIVLQQRVQAIQVINNHSCNSAVGHDDRRINVSLTSIVDLMLCLGIYSNDVSRLLID